LSSAFSHFFHFFLLSRIPLPTRTLQQNNHFNPQITQKNSPKKAGSTPNSKEPRASARGIGKQVLISIKMAQHNEAFDRVGAGLVTGPSHTTGHAVFRIRRLSPAASVRREIKFIQHFH
jgi:hypothetical protein